MKINSTDGTRVEIRIQDPSWSWVFIRIAGAWEDAQARVRTCVAEDTVSYRIRTALLMGGEVRITHE